jgi:hypothetical protein
MSTIISRNRNGQNSARDLGGRRFGRLTVLEKTERKEHGYIVWSAICDCGNKIERPSYRYIRGLSSCGCGPTGRPRIPRQGAHVNALYANRRNSAKVRNLEWSLTKEQARALFEGDCAYCGAAPSVTYTHANLSGDYAWNGIDRIDNAKGYTADNSVSCCATCNFAKGTMNGPDFKAWIARAYAHLFR